MGPLSVPRSEVNDCGCQRKGCARVGASASSPDESDVNAGETEAADALSRT